jgi:hypothetical protein
MKALLSVVLLPFLALLFPTSAHAVCPICTVAVGAGLGISRWLGIDDTVTGIWIGGLILSSGLWLADWIGKRGWKVPQKEILSVLLFFIFVIPPLYIAKMIGLAGNTLWEVDKVLLGTIFGSSVFLLGVWVDKWLRTTNDGKVYIYYQKVIIPSFCFRLAALYYFLLPNKGGVFMKKTMQPDINEFMDKVKKMEKGEKLDLSSDEDLSIGIMNLISMEEHFFFTYNKTKDAKYLDLLNEIREMRKNALKRIIKDYEGEVWCISKHLLAASMRFMEVGTKALTKNDKAGAEDMFQKSYQLYSLFWGLNLGLVQTKDVKQSETKEVAFVSDDPKPLQKGSAGIFAKLGELVQKAIDCCKE